MKVTTKELVSIASFVILLFIGWIDYATGYEFGFFIFYFIPVALTAWYVNRRAAFFMAFASAVTWYLSDLYTFHPYSNAFFIYWETFMRLISFLTTALTVSRIRQLVNSERQLNADLVRALDEVGKLRELLPACPQCDRFQADDALRDNIERYISERREDSATRHVCPECGRFA